MKQVKVLVLLLLVFAFSSCVKDPEVPIIKTFTDSRDGNTYNAINIGNQVWMTENLKYLPSVVGPETGSNTSPYYYVYGYDGTDVNAAKATENYQTYGVLYNWEAACSACPAGWHLPSDREWKQLINYIERDFKAGYLLKSKAGWSNGGNGLDDFDFTALPGGYRSGNGNFGSIGNYGYWWSSTEDATSSAWYRDMSYYYSNVYRGNYDKECGFSVRCVRD